MNELLQGLVDQSFPVVISIYLLIRLEAKLEGLEKVISTLNEKIHNICK